MFILRLTHHSYATAPTTSRYAASTLEELRAQLIEDASTSGQIDGMSEDWSDQIYAVYPLDPSELDDDEELPTARPLTSELLIELASDVLDAHPNHITLKEYPAPISINSLIDDLRTDYDYTRSTLETLVKDCIHTINTALAVVSEDNLNDTEYTTIYQHAAAILNDDDLPQSLACARSHYRHRHLMAEKSRRHRDSLIRLAHASGMTLGDIAAECNISHQMVRKIVGRS